jgi:hypothetical protein
VLGDLEPAIKLVAGVEPTAAECRLVGTAARRLAADAPGWLVRGLRCLSTVRRRRARFVAPGAPIVATRSRRAGSLPTLQASTDDAPKDTTMNTRTAPTLIALASALIATIVMLTGVDTLATSQPTPAQIAHASAGAVKA